MLISRLRWRAYVGYVGGAVRRSPGYGARTAAVYHLHGSTVRHHRTTSGQRSSIRRRLAYVYLCAAVATIAYDHFDACLVDVEAWLKASRLRLRPSKTQVMKLGSAQQLAKVRLDDVPVLSSQLSVVDTASSLGVVVDSQLSMYANVAAVCRGGYYQLRQLRPLKRCLTDEAIKTLTDACVHQ